VFVKTICKLDELPFVPFERVEDIFYSVVKYGAQALVPVTSPNEVGLMTLKGKKFLVPIKDLFRLFIEDNETKGVLNEVLSELPPEDRVNVLKYYSIIGDGFTASDFVISLWNQTKIRPDIAKIMSEVTKLSYEKKKTLWDILPKPAEYVLPNLDNKITIEELHAWQ